MTEDNQSGQLVGRIDRTRAFSASLAWLISEHEILEQKRRELQVSEGYSYQRRQFVRAPLWRRLLIALFPAKHFTPN